MNIVFVEPDKRLLFYIDEITVFLSDNTARKKQKTTPCPHTHVELLIIYLFWRVAGKNSEGRKVGGLEGFCS